MPAEGVDEGEGLQWGHGLAAVDGAYPGQPLGQNHSFNGATALRPWTVVLFATSAAEVECFNGATALRPWTGPQHIQAML